MSTSNTNRYVQPHNVREALETIEGLFNQYRHEPLTMELLKYHQQLVVRLETDIHDEAVRENRPGQLRTIETMIGHMQFWTKTVMNNEPFQYKMRHFKLVPENTTQFKRRVIKGHRAGSHRGTRH